MTDEETSDQLQDGATAIGDHAKAVSHQSILIDGNASVGGDVLGAGAIKTTITAELAYQVHGLPNPYLGLRSFTYEDRAAFAGREAAVLQARDLLINPVATLNLLFVTGASGSGKSSFVQAGLLPSLEKYYLQRHKRMHRAICHPSTAPLLMLADALEQLELPSIPAEQIKGISSESFNLYLSENTPGKQVNTLVIDQFEEVFVQSVQEQRDRLFTLLAGLASFSKTRTHVIVTIRSDYLDELFKHAPLWQIHKQGIELRTMTESELKEAIQQPLQAAGQQDERYQVKRFEPALLDRLAQDAAKDSAYLPLLQVTLQEIWKNGSLVLERYGQLTDAIRQRAETVYRFEDYDSPAPIQNRSEEEQEEVLKIFTDLVEVSLSEDSRRDVRRRRQKPQLIGDSISRSQIVNSLVNARLLSVSSETHTDSQVDDVDIIHESLIANWVRLQEAVAGKRQALQRRARFEQALAEWVANNRSDDYLLNGIRLAEGRELAKMGDVSLRSRAAQEFMRTSLQKAEAAQRKRTRIAWTVAAGLFVLVLFAIGAALVALDQRQKLVVEVATSTARLDAAIRAQGTAEAQKATSDALRFAESNARGTAQAERSVAVSAQATAVAEQKISRSRELAAIAMEQLKNDPETAVLISLEAVQQAQTLQASDSLFQALSANTVSEVLRGHEGSVLSADFSPDGKRVMTTSVDNTTRFWDVDSGTEITALRGDWAKAVFSPDGQVVLTVDDGLAWLWDAESGLERASIGGYENKIIDAVFSPDAKQILTTSDEGPAQLLDAESGEVLAVIDIPGSRVNRAVISPDGRRVLTTNSDGTVRLYDAESLAEHVVIGEFKGYVEAIFSPDGQRVLTVSDVNTEGYTVRLWEAESGTEEAVLSGEGTVFEFALFSPDGQRVLTAGQDGMAQLWDVNSATELASLQLDLGQINSAVFSPDSKLVLTAGSDGSARLWDAENGDALAELHGHDSDVSRAIFSPDGLRVLTASQDGTARLWDTKSRTQLAVMRGHEDSIYDAAFSSDGRLIVTASADRTVRLWYTESGEAITVLSGHQCDIYCLGITSAVFSPDGQWVLTAGLDGAAILWDSESGELLAQLDGNSAIYRAVFSPDGQRMLTIHNDNVLVWDISSGVSQAKVQTGLSLSNREWIHSAVFSPDGKRVLTNIGDYSRIVQLWDADSGEEIVIPGMDGSYINIESFSPDFTQVLAAGQCSSARILDAISGEELIVLGGYENKISSGAFSPDGRQVLTAGCGSKTRLWDTESGDVLVEFGTHETEALRAVFSSDGQHVLTVDSAVRLWDADSGKLLMIIRENGFDIDSVMISPNGQRVLIGRNDNTASLYDTRNEDMLAEMSLQEGSALFSSDGQRILTLNTDGTVWLWNAESGEALAVLRGHGGTIKSGVFSPDGKRVLTIDADGTVRIYPVDVDGLITLAKQRVTRKLTCEERNLYLSEEQVCPTQTQ